MAKNVVMKKTELVAAIVNSAEETTTKPVSNILDVLAAIITRELKSGVVVPLPGLGKFKVKDRAARTGRNPQTGAEVKIPAKRVVRFSPSKELKEAIAGAKPIKRK